MEPAELRALTVGDLRKVVSEAHRDLTRTATTETASKALRAVLAAYPAPDLADPEAFLAQAAEALTTFPGIVVARMASPTFGVVRKCKFVPRIAELVEWCEADKRALDVRLGFASTILAATEAAERRAQEAIERARLPRPSEEDQRRMAEERKAKAEEILRKAGLKLSKEQEWAQKRNAAELRWTRDLMILTKDRKDLLDAAHLFGSDEARKEQATEAELNRAGGGCALALGWVMDHVPSEGTPASQASTPPTSPSEDSA